MAGVVDVAVGNSFVDVSAVSRHVRSITLRSDLQKETKINNQQEPILCMFMSKSMVIQGMTY